MRTLFFECAMGAAGDMIASALLELQDDIEATVEALNHTGLDVVYRAKQVMSHGIGGHRLEVWINGEQEHTEDYGHHHEHGEAHECCRHHHEHGEAHECCGHHHEHGEAHECCGHHHEHGEAHTHGEHAHSHVHRGMAEIEEIVRNLRVSDKVRSDVLGIYSLIADAESKAHHCAVEQIHFHEVGALDAIADITAACVLIEKLGIDKVVVSPINVGSGWVRCAHGVLPVPAPATANILAHVPMYRSDIPGELCTPTGAAILKYFADEFSASPVMVYEKVGYGLGTKSFDRLNCLRAYLGERQPSEVCDGQKDLTSAQRVRLVQLECNLDDMTAESIAYASSKLFECGALDVWTIPIGMKKSRLGILLGCLCSEAIRNDMIHAMFRHTTTLGIREFEVWRHQLERKEYVRTTPYGEIRIKRAQGYGIVREKPEYEDIAKAADANDLSMAEILGKLSF